MATDLFVSEYDNAASIPSLSLSLSLSLSSVSPGLKWRCAISNRRLRNAKMPKDKRQFLLSIHRVHLGRC